MRPTAEFDYHSLRSRINQFLDGISNETEQELRDDLKVAYNDDEIDGQQYDNLIGYME